MLYVCKELSAPRNYNKKNKQHLTIISQHCGRQFHHHFRNLLSQMLLSKVPKQIVGFLMVLLFIERATQRNTHICRRSFSRVSRRCTAVTNIKKNNQFDNYMTTLSATNLLQKYSIEIYTNHDHLMILRFVQHL